MSKKDYCPVPLLETDGRLFLLKYDGRGDVPAMEFTQLDLLQMMRNLKDRNQRLYDKLYREIRAVDKATGHRTDFDRELPQRELRVRS